MIEKIKEGLEYVADFYRTAPLGETLFLMNIGQMPFHYDKPLLLGLNIFSSLASIGFSVRQFKLRHRLEKSVARHGYDDRIFKNTIQKACNRQTARVVTKNYGNLDNYLALCEANKDRISLF